MHKNSLLLLEKYALNYFEENQKIFEIGPCRKEKELLYKKLIEEKVKNINYYWGDLKNYNPTAPNFIRFISEYEIDLEDNYFDIVFCGNVIEHVRKPWIWMKELCRITKSGGKIIIMNPVSWGYHRAPVDCWRIYPEGMKALFEEANMKCIFAKFESLYEGVIDTISVAIK